MELLTTKIQKVMKISDFKSAYGALKQSKALILALPYWCFTEAGEKGFRAARNKSFAQTDIAIDVLKKEFSQSFPKTRMEAFSMEGFKFSEFFELLKEYPELAKENEEKLKNLLRDLKTGSLVPLQIDAIPDISEFV